ncbi:major facilitator superfamily domain-containing protein [Naematelia encephala]|uniref:Major facilitator superfamily domain-containing protein n=1 Tax=Naematelia encephala TaxID=71784 RepID=A0A1Y2AW27_9TREE|nr:major facilitator superfamily domain-containing protein [Naematelia encephala]
MAAPLDELSRALSQTTINGIEVVPPLGRQPPLSEEKIGDDKEFETEMADIPFEYPEGGYGWVVLGCCMTFAALTMGWGVSWGVFQSYYIQAFPNESPSSLALIGGLTGLFMNTTSYVSGRTSDKFGFKRVLYLSTFCSWLSFFLASWSTKLWQIMLTQGVMTGISAGMGLPVFFSLPSQWFHRRRGLASGLAVGGAGFGACICTILVRLMLVRIGVHHTLLIYSFINLILMSVATFLLRGQPNSPEANKSGTGPWFDPRIWKIGSFYLLEGCLLINTFGYTCVFFYLSEYASTLHHPKSSLAAAIPLSIANLCAGIGRVLVGFLADRIGALNSLFLSCLLASVFIFSLWLTATSFGAVMAFAVLYGLVAPTYLSLIPIAAIRVVGSDNLASNVGVCLMLTAPGAFAGGPVGGAILKATGQYKWLIVFAGAMHAFAAISIIICRFVLQRRILCKV